MLRKARFMMSVFVVFSVVVSGAAHSRELAADEMSNTVTSIKPKATGGLVEPSEGETSDREDTAFLNSGLFLLYAAYPVGSWPEAVAIGDVNNDRRNDVVMTTSYYFDPEIDFHIHVFLQNASGGLDPPVKYPAGNGDSIDIGDLNNDGKADVAVTAEDGIGVFLQNDSGGLDSMVTYSTDNTYKLRIGDLNSDRLLDVVSMGWSTHTVDVFLQHSDGTLDPAVSYGVLYGGYNDLEVGDVNDDGLADVIVMSGQLYGYHNIGVLLQNPDGTFGLPVYYDLGGDELTSGVAVGDINSDTSEDVVVTYGGNRPSSFIASFLQDPLGTLGPPISYPSYDIPEPVEIADVNLDGKKDVIVAHGGWNAMGVYLQGDDGMLLPYELYPLPYASHYNPHGLAVGDINGDWANDVAIADYNHGLVIRYHTRPPAPVVDRLRPRRCEPGEVIRIIGSNFGEMQGERRSYRREGI